MLALTIIFGVAGGCLLSVLIGILGSKRNIGFGWAFGLSLLNVFIGLVAVLLSKKIPRDEINKVERKEELK